MPLVSTSLWYSSISSSRFGLKIIKIVFEEKYFFLIFLDFSCCFGQIIEGCVHMADSLHFIFDPGVDFGIHPLTLVDGALLVIERP